MIYAGSRAVAVAYLGSTPLSEIYLGGALVWAGFRKPGAASLHLTLAQAAAGTTVTLVPLRADTRLTPSADVSGTAQAVVDTSAWHDIHLTMYLPTAQLVVVSPLTAEQTVSLTMTIPFVRSMILTPISITQDFAVTMTIPTGHGVTLHPVNLSQALAMTMRASGVHVQVMPGAADHVLPPVVGDIAPDVLTAQDGAAPERVELAMSAEAKAIYPRFVQRGDTVYIYRPMRWRQEGDTVYLDYTDAAWEAPEEDGDALIVRQVYSTAENGDYLEVT